jgi:hypothetical protein
MVTRFSGFKRIGGGPRPLNRRMPTPKSTAAGRRAPAGDNRFQVARPRTWHDCRRDPLRRTQDDAAGGEAADDAGAAKRRVHCAQAEGEADAGFVDCRPSPQRTRAADARRSAWLPGLFPHMGIPESTADLHTVRPGAGMGPGPSPLSTHGNPGRVTFPGTLNPAASCVTRAPCAFGTKNCL